jgi:hypothetical protein
MDVSVTALASSTRQRAGLQSGIVKALARWSGLRRVPNEAAGPSDGPSLGGWGRPGPSSLERGTPLSAVKEDNPVLSVPVGLFWPCPRISRSDPTCVAGRPRLLSWAVLNRFIVIAIWSYCWIEDFADQWRYMAARECRHLRLSAALFFLLWSRAMFRTLRL